MATMRRWEFLIVLAMLAITLVQFWWQYQERRKKAT